MARVNSETDAAHGRWGRRRSPPLRRLLGIGEDPLTWSFPWFKVAATPLRLHVVLPIWVAAECVASLAGNGPGLMDVSLGVLALLIVLIVRESVRSWVAAKTGSPLGTNILWPLGSATPAHRAEGSHPLMVEIAPVLAGMLMLPLLGGIVLAVGLPSDSLWINPWAPAASLPLLEPADPARVLVWWLYATNLIVLMANALLPMFPLDLGRAIYAWTARAGGIERAYSISGRIGLFAALCLFTFGATGNEGRVMAIAALAGIASFLELKRGEFIAYNPPMPKVHGALLAPTAVPDKVEPARPSVRPGRRVTGDTSVDMRADVSVDEDSNALDRVLSKISLSGLTSLSPDEQAVLTRETERRRRG